MKSSIACNAAVTVVPANALSKRDKTVETLQKQLTCDTSMKLGLAVEIKPKVLMVQFTNWERMSHAASADSVQLST